MNWDELIEQRHWKRIKSLLLADHSREQTHKSIGYILGLMDKNDVEAVQALLNIVDHWNLAPYSRMEAKNCLLGSLRRPHDNVKIPMIDVVLKNSSAAREWSENNTEPFLQALIDLTSTDVFMHYYPHCSVDTQMRHGLLISATNSGKTDVFKILFSDDAKDPSGRFLARACRQGQLEIIEFLLAYSNVDKARQVLWDEYSRDTAVQATNHLDSVVSSVQRQKLNRIIGHTNEARAQKKM